MPYLGSTPNASFSSRTKQDFTANGSTTAFTLSSAVASPNDIEVFVGNVRQEPTDAYTVNGTTLTMSEAPATGLNFYVVFKGVEENSVVPADGTISNAKLANDSVSTAKLADDSVTGAKIENNPTIAGTLGVTGGLKVGTIKEATGTNTAINIDSTGFASGLMVSAGRQSLASLNGYTWTGIPSTAKKIIVVYRLFFTQASQQTKTTLLRIGSNADAGNGIVTSGYESISSYMGGGSYGTESDTTGFFSYYWGTGTQNQTGKFELTYLDGNGWICSGLAHCTEVSSTATNTIVQHTGYRTLSGALDRVEIKIKDGTTLYSANSEAVLYYEG